MNKFLTFVTLVCLSLTTYSQVQFEEGYFIDNEDNKITCLIKNMEWRDNPQEFTYQLKGETTSKLISIESVKEFGIIKPVNPLIFKRFTVNIDQSTSDVSRMDRNRLPVFEEMQVFLQLIVEGKANLYYYEQGNLERYFFQLDNGEVKQLIYKRYLDQNNDFKENNLYKQQLLTEMKCDRISMADINRLSYKKRLLVEFFIKYNQCMGIEPLNYETPVKQDRFNLTFKGGNSFATADFRFVKSETRDTRFTDLYSPNLNLEAEYILPYNKNKWSIFANSSYTSFKANEEMIYTESILGPSSTQAFVEFQVFELSAGLRYYVFFNPQSKIYFNFALNHDIFFDGSTIYAEKAGLMDLEMRSRQNLSMGTGYKHKDRFLLELRWNINKELLADYMYYGCDYSSLSLMLGVTLW